MTRKPPPGILPWINWIELVDGDPCLSTLVARHREVNEAIGRYLKAGKPVPREWYREVGTR